MSEQTVPDASAVLAAHVIGTRYEDLPDNALAAARAFVLDSFGVALAGSTGPWMTELAAQSLRSHANGAGARLWGHRNLRTSTARAAMLNTCQIHNSEFDCIHEPAVVHPMTVVLGALASHIDACPRKVSGRELLRAVVLGVDVAAGLGVAARSGLRFFRPATAGAFGATAAIGCIEGMSEQQLTHAFGLAYAQACGTMQPHSEGLPLLALQTGLNARNAIEACELVDAGVTSTEGTLQGEFGYFTLFEEDSDLPSLLDSLGDSYRITEVAFKPFPSGRATHGVIDACLSLQREHALRAEDIARIDASVPPLTQRLVGRPQHDAMPVNYARLCATFATAAALRGGALGVADFGPAQLVDPVTLALGARIHITADSNPDPNALTPISVTMTLHDGRALQRDLDVVYGHPDRPMTRDAQVDKFMTNWRSAAVPLDAADGQRFIALVDEIEALDDTRTLIDLLAPGPDRAVP